MRPSIGPAAALLMSLACAGSLAVAPSRALAQGLGSQRPEDEPALAAVLSKARLRAEEPTPVALSLSMALGATFFVEVHVSTNGAVFDLSTLNREGFYKLELVELLLMSQRCGKPLRELADRRKKGQELREIALANGLDYPKVYDAALALQELVDREYLPRFQERRPRKERDQP